VIYFVHATGVDFVKIGYSTRPVWQRMRELQTSMPFAQLRFIGGAPGDLRVEANYHRLARPWRVGGEWFLYRPLREVIPRWLSVGRALRDPALPWASRLNTCACDFCSGRSESKKAEPS
jgi:T5orf172 domain